MLECNIHFYAVDDMRIFITRMLAINVSIPIMVVVRRCTVSTAAAPLTLRVFKLCMAIT